jgi:hypothetical protein
MQQRTQLRLLGQRAWITAYDSELWRRVMTRICHDRKSEISRQSAGDGLACAYVWAGVRDCELVRFRTCFSQYRCVRAPRRNMLID